MDFLTGKTAIVTGASRGIGRGVAECLARAGADLVVHASRREHLEGCVETVSALGRRCVPVGGDIALPETADQLVDTALNHFGRVGIMVNCAGMNRDGMLHKLTPEQWSRVIDVDLSGAFYLTARAAREMRGAGWGRIVHIGSAAWLGNLGQINYAAAKAGLVGLTRTAARELGGRGVTCNLICPGFIDTDMTRQMPEGPRQAMIARVPAARAGTPEDVGWTAAFLCSDAAGYINGQILGVDGGLVL